ncbi:hypothetical protein D9M71_523520 [compost metagenome]
MVLDAEMNRTGPEMNLGRCEVLLSASTWASVNWLGSISHTLLHPPLRGLAKNTVRPAGTGEHEFWKL